MFEHIDALAKSPFVIGMFMLLLNIGSRYVVHEFSESEEEYSQNVLLRRLTIFAVCFVGTRDLIVSILLTAGFVILASGLLRGSPMAREGLANPEENLRKKAGLEKVDAPAYDKDHKQLFN